MVPPVLPLVGGRDEAWRFDLLDTTDRVVGVLDSVTGGQIEGGVHNDIRVRGMLGMVGREILDVDWTRSRVRVWYSPDGWDTSWPMITGIPATPKVSWSGGVPSAQVDLFDKTLIARSAKATSTYTVDAGVDPVEAAVSALAEIGQTSVVAEPAGNTLRVPMTWDVHTPFLKIVNDLLAAGNHFALASDGFGVWQVTPYQSPSQRGVSYTSRTGHSPIHGPDLGGEWDAFEVPNRWTSVSTSDIDVDPLVATATDEDPASPFSYPSRGFWVDDGDQDVATTSQSALEAHAARRLADAQSVYGKYQVRVAPLPPHLLDLNRVIRVIDTPAGVDVTGVVQSYTAHIEGDPLVSVTLREVRL